MCVSKYEIALALRDYLEWVANGAEDTGEAGMFKRSLALCFNVGRHIRKVQGERMTTNTEVMHAMGSMFAEDGLHRHFPFGGLDVYDHEGEACAYHLNIDRLEWARNVVARYC